MQADPWRGGRQSGWLLTKAKRNIFPEHGQDGQCYQGVVHLLVCCREKLIHLCCFSFCPSEVLYNTLMLFLLFFFSDVPMAQFIVNLNASMPASERFIVHMLDPTHMFVQPHVAEMIRSKIAEFWDQNSYEKPQ